ncbi:MAG: DUF2313 domain-containing protein [Alphaproteobacteria bacterium]|nr:DUF2313 domain-containing protein [Alphaproteobacteria bacterium]
MAHTAEQYRDAATAMLPYGPAWNRARGARMWQFWYAVGALMSVLESDLAKIALETRMRFTTELLPEWERDYGITPDPSLSIAERRAQLLQLANKKTFPSISGLEELAADVGYTIRVVRHKPFMCGDLRCVCGNAQWEIGVTRSVIGIIVTDITGNLTMAQFTEYITSFLPAHVTVSVVRENE